MSGSNHSSCQLPSFFKVVTIFMMSTLTLYFTTTPYQICQVLKLQTRLESYRLETLTLFPIKSEDFHSYRLDVNYFHQKLTLFPIKSEDFQLQSRCEIVVIHYCLSLPTLRYKKGEIFLIPYLLAKLLIIVLHLFHCRGQDHSGGHGETHLV